MVDFNKSGNHSSDFRKYNRGDSVLHYMYVMYKDNSMLMQLAEKRLDGGAGTESAVGASLTPGGARARSTAAVRSNTLSKRLGRERNDALSLMAESSVAMADSSRRRAAAATVQVLSASLSDAHKTGSSDVVIRAMEQKLLQCLDECTSGPLTKRVRGDDTLNAGGMASTAARGGIDGNGPAEGDGLLMGGDNNGRGNDIQLAGGASDAGSGRGHGYDMDSVLGAPGDGVVDSLGECASGDAESGCGDIGGAVDESVPDD